MTIRGNQAARRRAAAAVELALLAPFLAFLIVVGVDFARVYYFSLTLTNCARNGAVYATLDPNHSGDTGGIVNAALADASDLMPAPQVAAANITDAEGHPAVRVTVTWTFQTVTNAPGLPGSYKLVRTMQMRVAPENPNNS